MHKDKLNIAAVADVHCSRTSQGAYQGLFSRIADEADILLLCGDLTDYGLPEEAQILTKELGRVSKIPILAVFGNHDWESENQQELREILGDAGVIVLDGDTYEHEGIGFVGVKGFGGGFGKRMLEPWGEPVIKAFVREAVNESMKLETGLARLKTEVRIVMMHYAPIETTVEGEPEQTIPFLGSSRFEEPLNRYAPHAVFHGHAHYGSVEGKTREGVPVFNVSAPLLHRTYPDRPPFRLFTVPLKPSESRDDVFHVDSSQETIGKRDV